MGEGQWFGVGLFHVLHTPHLTPKRPLFKNYIVSVNSVVSMGASGLT